MNIVVWFNPYNSEHVEAYSHMLHTFTWPDGFLPNNEKIYYPNDWRGSINLKMAKAWMEEVMAGNISGIFTE